MTEGAVQPRRTRQRSAIASLISATDSFQSAQEIHHLLRSTGEVIGLSTVYRTLQSLAEAGEIDVVINADGESVYRRCGQGRGLHYHLVCRICGHAVEVAADTIDRWVRSIAREHRFSEAVASLTVFGICRACASAT